MTLITAVIAVTVSVLIGVPIGLVGGYWPGFVGDGLMRVSDVFLAVPQIVLAMAIAADAGAADPERDPCAVADLLAVLGAAGLCRDTQREERDLLSRRRWHSGFRRWRVMVLHILPAIAPSLIIRTSIELGGWVPASALGFLGLGPPPPSPEWGRMIADARAFLPGAWWDAAAPGVAILVLVIAFNLLGDGLRDVLDPRLRRQGTVKGAEVE